MAQDPFEGLAANSRWAFHPRPPPPRLPWDPPRSWLDPPGISAAAWARMIEARDRAVDIRRNEAPQEEMLPAIPDTSEEDAKRARAFRKWVTIARALGSSCTLGSQLLVYDGSAADSDAITALLQDTFGTKATSTLNRRASAWRLFFQWCNMSGVASRVPSEPVLYSYVAEMRRDGAPASRA